MEDYKKRITRLLNIILTLEKRVGMKIKELSFKYKVSTRTIYRDIDIIHSAGVLIYSKSGKYYIKEER
jgi:predicted DNA-binding transcriptional regulator YafY